MNALRIRHLENALLHFDREIGRKPLNGFLKEYFFTHRKSLNVTDQQFLEESIGQMIKWREVLDHLCVNPQLRPDTKMNNLKPVPL